MDNILNYAPGWPGSEPRWTSSAKSGIGTALNRESRIWFSLSHGILNEIYYPRVDQACTRDMGLIVTDGKDFFSEEKRHALHETNYIVDGVPAYKLVNTCVQGRYRIEKEILTDPKQATLLQRTKFTALKGKMSDYHLYVLLAPHLANQGSHNTAWVGKYNGRPMLFVEREGYALALACSENWLNRSVGFVGVSDGWQDLNTNKCMTWLYDRAENGNVALTGEIDFLKNGGEFSLALGFGNNTTEAAKAATDSLIDGFDSSRKLYVSEWEEWNAKLTKIKFKDSRSRNLNPISAIVMRTCESKEHPGGIVASLSLPWGFAKGDDDLGGYHLIWPRDLAETAGALLALGANQDVKRILSYLESTQLKDGHWSQNMWIDGTPYWGGIQLDETAFPILITDLARREKVLNQAENKKLWPMIRSAAIYLVKNGPVAMQDRWEEDPGYSPFTLAATISALLVAADFADKNNDKEFAKYLRETADCWNENIEDWTYVINTDLARRIGVEGYYVRIAPPESSDAASPLTGFVPIKNRPLDQSLEPASQIISPDALALVRFGLRSANDPRILNTIKAIDALLKVDTPQGPIWHRYNDDGYGEHEDGAAFDGTGIGRAWPLMTGERAHYELAAGRFKEAEQLLVSMEALANESGLIPEQIWDSKDIPERELFFGRPSGSAMPLVWAHAEQVKLSRSLQDGYVFDMPKQSAERYLNKNVRSPFSIWRFNHKCHTICAGKTLRIELLAPAVIRWSSDDWKSFQDTEAENTGADIYKADIETTSLNPDEQIQFTFLWSDVNRWEGKNFAVKVVTTTDG
jgi:glucoamylase